jgi:adenylate cyclase
VYGTVVNLAARLAGVARPGSVLIDRELAGEIGEDPEFRVRRLRRVAVRGFAHLQPWLLRRAHGADGT